MSQMPIPNRVARNVRRVAPSINSGAPYGMNSRRAEVVAISPPQRVHPTHDRDEPMGDCSMSRAPTDARVTSWSETIMNGPAQIRPDNTADGMDGFVR